MILMMFMFTSLRQFLNHGFKFALLPMHGIIVSLTCRSLFTRKYFCATFSQTQV